MQFEIDRHKCRGSNSCKVIKEQELLGIGLFRLIIYFDPKGTKFIPQICEFCQKKKLKTFWRFQIMPINRSQDNSISIQFTWIFGSNIYQKWNETKRRMTMLKEKTKHDVNIFDEYSEEIW